jgi:glycosyltransferase involved in cell wall biosynthesis
MPRPKVLHVGKFYPPYKGGMETHLQQLCHALQNDVDIEVIVANDSAQTVHERDGDINVHRLGALANIASAPICPGMAKLIRNTPADIIHLHMPNPAAVVALFASRHPAKIVVTHQSDVLRQRVLNLAYEPWLRWMMSRASRIIALTPNYIQSSTTLARYREKCVAIPHGINLAEFEHVDQQQIAEIQRRFGAKIVLAVGRLVYYKGFEYLVRAISETDATLLIIGTGPLREKLVSVAHDSHVADRVHFLGEVNNVLPYYCAARMFALASVARSEAFGIVQLEAMACGTPVINTNLDTGVPFVSLNGVSGLTVAPANSGALRDAINSLLCDDELHRRLALGARHRVREHFTVSRMAEQTLQLYKEVLSGAPATPQAKAATLAG